MSEKRPVMSKVQVDYARRELCRVVHERKDAITKEHNAFKPAPPTITAAGIVDLIESGKLVPNPDFVVRVNEDGYSSSVYLNDVFPNWRTHLDTMPGRKEYAEAMKEWKALFQGAHEQLEKQFKLAEREIILGDVQEALRILRAFEAGQPIPVQLLADTSIY